MELAKVSNGAATRDPVPDFLVGLTPADLANLDWVDPALGLAGSGWWPVVDESPALAAGEQYGAETLAVDAARQVVVSVRAVVLPASGPVVPQRVPMLNAHLVLIETGLMPALRTFLDAMPGTEGDMARAQFEMALTMARNHPLVLDIPAALGVTEAEVDQLFITAGALNV